MVTINPFEKLKVGSIWFHRSKPSRRVLVTGISGAVISIRDVSGPERRVMGMNTKICDELIAATFVRCYKPED